MFATWPLTVDLLELDVTMKLLAIGDGSYDLYLTVLHSTFKLCHYVCIVLKFIVTICSDMYSCCSYVLPIRQSLLQEN